MGEAETTVLVVDDERFFREAIQDALAADGLDCRMTGTAAEAVELAQEPAVGVVVLDIQLPDGTGLDVLRALREVRPEVRVVVLSAHTDQEYVLEALRLGACDYLAKPLHEEELRLSVRRALETFRVARGSAALQGRLERLAEETARLAALPADADRTVVAERVVEAAGRVLGAARTSLLWLDESAGELRVAAAAGHKVEAGELDPVPLGALVAGLVAARGEAMVVEDAARDARLAARSTPAGRYRSASFVVVPVMRGSSRLGALCATERADESRFTASDAALLRVLADVAALCAPALAGGSGTDLTAPLPFGEPVPVDEADAELARAVCEAVTAEVEPERLLGAALRAVGQQLDAAPVSLYLAQGPDGPLVREGQWEGRAGADRATLARSAGLAGAVFASGQPVATDAPAEDPRFDPAVDTPADGAGEGGLIVVPLRFRGRSLGVARAFLPAGREASPRTAEVLGAALSAAARNVLLYRSLLDSIEEVARVRREARAGTR